jgi:uracil-DNA glycosylase
VEFVTHRVRNPFDQSPPCEEFVAGFGNTDAHFHVIGDHPGVHGGLETDIPFTGRPWSAAFFEALEACGLVERIAWVEPDSAALDSADGERARADGSRAIETVVTDRTFFSYLHLCLPDGEPEYERFEPFFDAELRAIVAHVLLPVGERATRHVLRTYTARPVDDELDMDALHATEIRGSGWLIVPVKDPATWTDDDSERFVQRMQAIQASDYRRESDLGRFLPGSEPYRVR